jgi:hypothetical protein
VEEAFPVHVATGCHVVQSVGDHVKGGPEIVVENVLRVTANSARNKDKLLAENSVLK